MQQKSCRFLFDLRLSAVLIFLLSAMPHWCVAVNVLLAYSIWNRKIVFKVKEIHSQNQLSTAKKHTQTSCCNRHKLLLRNAHASNVCVCVEQKWHMPNKYCNSVMRCSERHRRRVSLFVIQFCFCIGNFSSVLTRTLCRFVAVVVVVAKQHFFALHCNGRIYKGIDNYYSHYNYGGCCCCCCGCYLKHRW